MAGVNFLKDAVCQDCFKDNGLHQYDIEVEWTSGKTLIRRKYSDLFDLRNTLKQLLQNKDNGTNLPQLPGQKWFQNFLGSQDKRKKKMTEFLKSIFQLPETIQRDSSVVQFFQTTHQDAQLEQSLLSQENGIKVKRSNSHDSNIPLEAATKAKQKQRKISEANAPAPADITIGDPARYIVSTEFKLREGSTTLARGQEVEVTEKNADGWWFVSVVDDGNNESETQGWFPNAFLEPLNVSLPTSLGRTSTSSFPEDPLYEMVEKFKPSREDELDCEKGQSVQVLDKGADGWWKVRLSGKEQVGYVPAACLAIASEESHKFESKSIYRKEPPPRRNITKESLRDLYTMVIPKQQRPGNQGINYTEVEVRPANKKRILPPLKPVEPLKQSATVEYATVHPITLPPKKAVMDSSNSQEIYLNIANENSSNRQTYENIEYAPPLPKRDRFYEVTDTYNGTLSHLQALHASKGAIVKSLDKESCDMLHVIMCNILGISAIFTKPFEGWIPKGYLKEIQVDVIDGASAQGLPVVNYNQVELLVQDGQAANFPAVPPRPTNRQSHFIDQSGQSSSSATGERKPRTNFRSDLVQSHVFSNNMSLTELKLTEAQQILKSRSQPWMAGVLSRQECENKMANAKDRQFLIRESADKSKWSLSVKYKQATKHFQILPTDNNKYMLGKVKFTTMDDIVKYYSENPLFAEGKENVSLGEPFIIK